MILNPWNMKASLHDASQEEKNVEEFFNRPEKELLFTLLEKLYNKIVEVIIEDEAKLSSSTDLLNTTSNVSHNLINSSNGSNNGNMQKGGNHKVVVTEVTDNMVLKTKNNMASKITTNEISNNKSPIHTLFEDNENIENDKAKELIANSENDVESSTEFINQQTGYIDSKKYHLMSHEFTNKETKELLGQLACLYPISRSLIKEVMELIKEDNSVLNNRAATILENYIYEIYAEDSSDIRFGESIQCNGCKRNLRSYHYKMKCLECVDFDLCDHCLCKKIVTEKHSYKHYYIVLAPTSISLLNDNWTISEDLVLLEAIGKYGIGNWDEVCQWVSELSNSQSRPKDKIDCENRYFNVHLTSNFSFSSLNNTFLYKHATLATNIIKSKRKSKKPVESVANYEPIYNSDNYDLVCSSTYRPAISIEVGSNLKMNNLKCNTTISDVQTSLNTKKQHDEVKSISEYERYETNSAEFNLNTGIFDSNNSMRKANLGSSDFYKNDVNLQNTENESKLGFQSNINSDDEYELPIIPTCYKYQACKPPQIISSKVAILGYLPNRGDLDIEWENNAEFSICDLCIRTNESPVEKQTKLLALEAYNCILDERWACKRLYINCKIYEQKARVSTDTQDIQSIFKPFWKYIYYNYTYYPQPLYTKSHEYFDITKSYNDELLQEELEQIPELIADDVTLQSRLNLLASWVEKNLTTIEHVLNRGKDISDAMQDVSTYLPNVSLEQNTSVDLELWLKEHQNINNREYKIIHELIAKQPAKPIDHSKFLPQFVYELKHDNLSRKDTTVQTIQSTDDALNET